jgi:hypothetical protein
MTQAPPEHGRNPAAIPSEALFEAAFSPQPLVS